MDKIILCARCKKNIASVFITKIENGVTKNEDLPWKERDHALFVGFAPVDNPRYAIAVVVEHGGSGAHIAVPIARDIMIECQKRDPAGKGA